MHQFYMWHPCNLMYLGVCFSFCSHVCYLLRSILGWQILALSTCLSYRSFTLLVIFTWICNKWKATPNSSHNEWLTSKNQITFPPRQQQFLQEILRGKLFWRGWFNASHSAHFPFFSLKKSILSATLSSGSTWFLFSNRLFSNLHTTCCAFLSRKG